MSDDMRDHRCLDEGEIFALLDEPDGEGAVAAAAHVASCATCATKKAELEGLVSDLREPVRAFEEAPFVAKLEASAKASDSRSRSRIFVVAGAAAGALALAASALLFLRSAEPPTYEAGFASRNIAVEAGAARDVYLSLQIVIEEDSGGILVIPASDASTTTAAHLVVNYATESARTPFHLLGFAVDRVGDVHWLYPAFTDATSNPASMVLPPQVELKAMATEALLDDFPEGPLRVVAVVSPVPLHVGDIERLPPSDLSRDRLLQHFAGSDVREWNLELRASSDASPQ